MEKRFIPKQRTAVDGKSWWCVYDTEKNTFSTLIVFGKYRTRKECAERIDFVISCCNELI